jgi:hypothetical protein
MQTWWDYCLKLSWATADVGYLETTAHVLAATIGFLSIHEDIQEEVWEQIKSVIGL